VRHEAACSKCSALERHRLFKVWYDRNEGVLSGKSVLHFAPEAAITRIVRPRATGYLTADIVPGLADLTIDIERIDAADQSFDVIICFHVLEHVNDQAALSEMHRVLTVNGRLLLMTPVIEGWQHTYENPDIQSAEDRELHFGQRDHVRVFGADLRNRVAAAGFAVSEFTAEEPYVSSLGLLRGEKLFICDKR
jgi:SAM-dependent methyltransferase